MALERMPDAGCRMPDAGYRKMITVKRTVYGRAKRRRIR
jgi:hypothetical protein